MRDEAVRAVRHRDDDAAAPSGAFALEPAFFRRLTELLGRPELADRQFDADQEVLAIELAAIFEAHPLAEWLELFEAEDVCVGPVATIAEAASDLT